MTRPAIPTAITYNGQTLTLKQWAERTGVPATRIYSRLGLGWSVARALTEITPADSQFQELDQTPKARSLNNVRRHDFAGESLTIPEWSIRTGISVEVIRKRLWTGWHLERALTQPVRVRQPCCVKPRNSPALCETPNLTTNRAAPTEGPGVVSDLGGFQRTGGGRSAQDTSNITFSPNEAAA